MDVGTRQRIQDIYRRNNDMVYRICFLYLKNEQDAYDAAHETFVRLIQKDPEFPGDSRMIFTGGGFLLRCDSSRETQFSLNTLEVVLKDGTTYYYDADKNVWIEHAKRIDAGEMEIFREESGLKYISGTFEDYIDVSDIVSVSVNGVPGTL